jgi:toxin ParE1/3/4
VRRVRFHEGASAEAEAAVGWYNERVPGLGEDFRIEVVNAIERVIEAPLAWPVSAYDPRARRCLLARFPYSVVYVLAGDEDIIVAAVAHARRRPGYWSERVSGSR